MSASSESRVRMLLLAVCAAVVTASHEAGGQERARAPQPSPGTPTSGDSTRVVANARYTAGSLHRLMLGGDWRDVWAAPISVPYLDLGGFAGGLRPTEVGGGNQTRSLRLVSGDGRAWTFRPVYKAKLEQLARFEGTVIMDLLRDGLSANFPASPVVAPPFLEAIGVLHPKPELFVMPDDARLGEYREEFSGRLGTIEEHVSDDEETKVFGGAADVIDSEDLLEELNESPRRRVDARAFLRVRLVDMLVNDNDRHADQWRWARLRQDDSLWTPIPRDRDRIFVSYDGVLLRLARYVKPNLITFDSSFASPKSAAGHELDLDGRLLGSLDRAAWEEEIATVTRAITDSVIHAALGRLPDGYRSTIPRLAGTLQARRARLRDVALGYYESLSRFVTVHATDTIDVAQLERDGEGGVTVALRQPGAAQPWYSRRFVPSETQELHLYLHGGDDSALVRGSGPAGVTLRVIGGNGRNTLADSAVGTTGSARVHLYDRGHIEGIDYATDTAFTGAVYEPDTAFNRRPWLLAYGKKVPPGKAWGRSLSPMATLRTGRGLGIVPGIGIRRTEYAFRRVPYKNRFSLRGEYSTGVSGFRVVAEGDIRIAERKLFTAVQAEMTDFEIVEFRGFGNDVTFSRDPVHEVRQRQWIARPAVGLAFGPESELTIGPVVKYAVADSTPGRLISELQPLGFPRFGQAGLEMQLRHDSRDNGSNPSRGWLLRASASAYPSLWDVDSPFQRLQASATTYLPVPLRKGTVLAVRVGGERVFGDFPFFEAAFLGGGRTLRSMRYNQLAGDATVFGNAELRVPVARIPFILPFDVGLLAYSEHGRVYLDGASPGGWHSATGAGFWLGVLGPAIGVNVLFTNSRERAVLLGTGVNF